MKIKNYLLLILAGLIILVSQASAVEINTGVPLNPINSFNKQLREKEAQLLKKEVEIGGKVFIGGGIILALVLLNFYLDYRHRQNSKNEN